MGTRDTHGFTIIETMLFLGVTGLLILGMVAGASESLATQRYRDATEMFKGLVQQQYSELRDVQNNRSTNWACGSNAQPVQDSINETLQGQGDCLFVGKFMRVNGADVSIYRVLAYQTGKIPGTDDFATMKKNYTFGISQSEIDNRVMEWGTQIAWPVSGGGAKNPTTPRQLGILFLRSPESGSMYTFTRNDIVTDGNDPTPNYLKEMIITDWNGPNLAGQAERTICINSGNFMAGGDRAVYINKFASGTSSIETLSNDIAQSQGKTSKC